MTERPTCISPRWGARRVTLEAACPPGTVARDDTTAKAQTGFSVFPLPKARPSLSANGNLLWTRGSAG